LPKSKEVNGHLSTVFRTTDTQDQKENSPYHIIVKMPRVQNKERILKASRKKH
jgi:hypothetical protein